MDAIEKRFAYGTFCVSDNPCQYYEEDGMDEGQGQGIAWIVFLVWVLVPLLVFFIGLTFTG